MTGRLTNYELGVYSGNTELRAYGSRFDMGFCAVESLPTAHAKQSTVAMLADRGAKLARANKVRFVNALSKMEQPT